ncbi:MAG: hypothetical protein IPJ23_12455 [Ignavibacteriales bacterium]|nr:hypothetical protein [Ignavibacteriales bacterium]
MKAILIFLTLQSLHVLLGMSDGNILSVIVLCLAISIFVASYVGVVIKDRKNKKQLINALSNAN